jgi:hypothetical protein
MRDIRYQIVLVGQQSRKAFTNKVNGGTHQLALLHGLSRNVFPTVFCKQPLEILDLCSM